MGGVFESESELLLVMKGLDGGRHLLRAIFIFLAVKYDSFEQKINWPPHKNQTISV